MAKTRADLLIELNANLEKKNEELLNEVRKLKSDATMYKGSKGKLDHFNEIQDENTNLKIQVAGLTKQNEIQSKQIDILLKGINETNEAINKYFANLGYTLQLARENYDRTFESIRFELNQLTQQQEKENK